MKKTVFGGLMLSLLLAACASDPVATPESGSAGADRSREVLAPKDGWGAAAPGGVTGGSAAKPENVITVSSRKQLVDAFKKLGNEPKIIQIKGTINLNVDDAGRELTTKDYAPDFDFEAYKKAYDPAVWNRQDLVKGKPPKLTGPLEVARDIGAKKQKKHVVVEVPSNTTIVGLGQDAKIVRGNLFIGKTDKDDKAVIENVIIRNITFEDAFDLFPAWEPGDSYKVSTEALVINGVNYAVSGCQEKFESDTKGPHRCNGGRWNSEYDLISINGGQRVWIDHCTFSDGDNFDKKYPPVYAAPYNQPEQKIQHHDALIDITNEANFVTISNNHFLNHDKTGLIGSSDSRKTDAGKLKVTFRHNLFENTKQRTPRVRFGEVHLFNNYFVGDRHHKDYSFAYGIGVGIDSKVYSENNYYDLDASATPADLITVFNGKNLFDQGTMLNGKTVDVLADHNAKNPKLQLSPNVGWKPQNTVNFLPTADVPKYVRANAGAGKL